MKIRSGNGAEEQFLFSSMGIRGLTLSNIEGGNMIVGVPVSAMAGIPPG